LPRNVPATEGFLLPSRSAQFAVGEGRSVVALLSADRRASAAEMVDAAIRIAPDDGS